MSRMKTTFRTQSNMAIQQKSSRIMGTSIGMGRDPRNYPARSPRISNKYNTPEKIKESNGGSKYYSVKKQTQFDPKQYMVAECSMRDIEIYKQVFDFLDQDHDGNLTPLDLRKCIRQFGGYNPGRKFVYVAMSVFDSDDGGQIDFREFIKLMTLKPYQKDTEDDLLRVFESVDEDGKGYIDQNDLIKLAEQMNMSQKQKVPVIDQIRQAIKYAAPNGEGKISFKQFVQFCRRKDYD